MSVSGREIVLQDADKKEVNNFNQPLDKDKWTVAKSWRTLGLGYQSVNTKRVFSSLRRFII